MKINFLKIFPFIVTIIISVVFYLFAKEQQGSLQVVLLNISSSLIAIPLIFVFYQSIQNFSKKKLNKEILDYCKKNVDTDVLSIVRQLQKLVYPLEEEDTSFKGIDRFLNLKDYDINQIISANKYLGFQVFKHWEITEKNITETLKHPLIIGSFNDELIVCIISILKNIYSLEKFLQLEDLYIETGETNNDYKIVHGSQLNPDNADLPDRYLLLKILKNDKFLVSDFGDIHLYNEKKCLKMFMVNPEYCSALSALINDLIKDFNTWISLTGAEFIIDPKNFRIVKTSLVS